MKIAILGASGRVGSRIAKEALMRGHQVVGIDVNIKEELKNQVEFHKIDMEDTEGVAGAIQGCDVYIFAVIPVLKGLDRIIPVSYTHLDVYKRQPQS